MLLKTFNKYIFPLEMKPPGFLMCSLICKLQMQCNVKHRLWIKHVNHTHSYFFPFFFLKHVLNCFPPLQHDNRLPGWKSRHTHLQRLTVHQHYRAKASRFTSGIKWDEYWSSKEDLFISSAIQRSTESSFQRICSALTAQIYCTHDSGLDILVLEENQTVNLVQ